MAFKEWKKYAENEWWKPTDRYTFAKVWRIGLSSGERKKRGIGLYGFSGRIGINGTETRKTFKKKSQALKFARSYMRTH